MKQSCPTGIQSVSIHAEWVLVVREMRKQSHLILISCINFERPFSARLVIIYQLGFRPHFEYNPRRVHFCVYATPGSCALSVVILYYIWEFYCNLGVLSCHQSVRYNLDQIQPAIYRTELVYLHGLSWCSESGMLGRSTSIVFIGLVIKACMRELIFRKLYERGKYFVRTAERTFEVIETRVCRKDASIDQSVVKTDLREC